MTRPMNIKEINNHQKFTMTVFAQISSFLSDLHADLPFDTEWQIENNYIHAVKGSDYVENTIFFLYVH